MPVSSLTWTPDRVSLARPRGHGVGEALAPGDHVGARRQRDVELLGGERPEDERPCRLEPARAQLGGLLGGGHREPGRAAGPAARAAAGAPWP